MQTKCVKRVGSNERAQAISDQVNQTCRPLRDKVPMQIIANPVENARENQIERQPPHHPCVHKGPGLHMPYALCRIGVRVAENALPLVFARGIVGTF